MIVIERIDRTMLAVAMLATARNRFPGHLLSVTVEQLTAALERVRYTPPLQVITVELDRPDRLMTDPLAYDYAMVRALIGELSKIGATLSESDFRQVLECWWNAKFVCVSHLMDKELISE